jgi:type VII secretion protein EccB
MASRRDLYQGYRFALRRQAGALLRADLDAADGPLRRLSNGVVASITLALLVMLGAGLYGILSPAGGRSGWQNGKTLIVDTQTGSRYVYLGGQLHPVLNYASALLVLKAGAVGATRVSDATVNSVPHGPAVGILGAPETVPGSGSLMTGTWSVCSAPAQDASGADHPLVRAALGAAPGGSAVPTGSGLLVRDVPGAVYLVWNNIKLHIPADAAGYVLTALGGSATTPVTVGDALLNALPQGPDLAAPAIAGLGGAGPAVPGVADGTKAGEVFQVSDTGAYYAAQTGGLAPVTALQAQLLLVEQRQVSPVSVTASQVQAVPAAPLAAAGALPTTVPKLAALQPDSTKVCAQPADASQGTVTVATSNAIAQILSGTPPEPVDALGAPLADSVAIPSGKGALVRTVPQPGVTNGPLFLITDLGVKYPITNPSVLSDLGLNNVTASQIPQSMAALIPTGPALDESAALAQQAPNPLGTASGANP